MKGKSTENNVIIAPSTLGAPEYSAQELANFQLKLIADGETRPLVVFSGGSYQVWNGSKFTTLSSVYGTNLNKFTAAAEVNTSAPHTTWVNRINVNTSALEAGDYELTLSYGWNHNATNSDFESRLSFDGTILGDVFGNGTTHKEEPKDSSGTGGGSSTSQQLNFSRTFPMTLTAGIKPIVFDFRSDDSSDLSTTWGVYIKLIRVS